MPPTSLPWAWVWAVLTLLTLTLAETTDNATPPPLLSDVSEEMCEGKAPPVTTPEVEVTWERNGSQVVVNCPPKLHTLFTSLLPDVPPQPPAAPSSASAVLVKGQRGVVLNLTQLLQEGIGGQIVVDVEQCGCVGMAVGVPDWAEGLTLAIRGSLWMPRGWWMGDGTGLREMWVRVNDGLAEGGVCDYLPPTLETLDLSDTPIGQLVLEKTCAPSPLQRLEAISSALTLVSLCTPALTILYLNNNEVSGNLDFANCEGGVSSVMYLHVNNNQLTSASTCSWPSLTTLELRRNWLTTLDVASCPPRNLTSLIASRNYLSAAPSPLPPALVILDLSHNNITALPVFTRALQEADFSYNNLRSIGEGRFERARKLHQLNLAHNHITEIAERDFYGLKKLHRLNLSHNKLKTITASALIPLHQLRHLHLHHNQLTHLDARDLDALSSTNTQGTHATHATLHSNPWACNCQMLAALSHLQACADCKHKRVALQCRERNHLQDVTALLHTCLQAIQVSQGRVDESDEDYSEEIRDAEDKAGTGAVLIVPSLVVLIVLAVSVACGYKVYRKHRRALITRLSPMCGWCGGCASSGINNNNHNHHHHHQEASQLPTGELQDSDTETEM